MSSRAAQRQNEEAQLRQGWMNAGGSEPIRAIRMNWLRSKTTTLSRIICAETGFLVRNQPGRIMPILPLMPMAR
jgi:hypothetical protein